MEKRKDTKNLVQTTFHPIFVMCLRYARILKNQLRKGKRNPTTQNPPTMNEYVSCTIWTKVCPLNTDPDHVMLRYMVRIGIKWAHHTAYISFQAILNIYGSSLQWKCFLLLYTIAWMPFHCFKLVHIRKIKCKIDVKLL